jgi:Spy/CpxP family protein refolding chaperone
MKGLWTTVGMLMLALGSWQLAYGEDAKAITPGDKAAIDANTGKEAVVEGTVSDAQWSASGAVFIMKFKDSDATQFQAVVLRNDMAQDAAEKAFGGDLSNIFEGSKVRIKGELGTYFNHPQIKIKNADQVAVLDKGPGNSPHAGKRAAAIARTGGDNGANDSKPRLYGVYQNLKVTDDQRDKIAAIQKDAHEQELALEKKLREESDAKIAAILTDEQKEEVKKLQASGSRPKAADGD